MLKDRLFIGELFVQTTDRWGEVQRIQVFSKQQILVQANLKKERVSRTTNGPMVMEVTPLVHFSLGQDQA